MATTTIAGQCRTNPWLTVPDWTLMPKCRCRTEAAGYRKKCRCRTNFSPAFRHLHMIFQYHIAKKTPSTAVYGRACRVYSFPPTAVWTWRVYRFPQPAVWMFRVYTPFLMPECRTVRHPGSPVPVQEWTKMRMQNQSSTRMLRCRTEIQDAGMPMTTPYMECLCRHPGSQSGTGAFWYWTGSCIPIFVHSCTGTGLTGCPNADAKLWQLLWNAFDTHIDMKKTASRPQYVMYYIWRVYFIETGALFLISLFLMIIFPNGQSS
jgi:hypothetical protein